MIKFLIVVIFLVNCLAKLPRPSCAKEINEPRPRPYIRLRTFAIHSLKTLSNLRKAYELQQQKLKEEIENLELKRKMKDTEISLKVYFNEIEFKHMTTFSIEN